MTDSDQNDIPPEVIDKAAEIAEDNPDLAEQFKNGSEEAGTELREKLVNTIGMPYPEALYHAAIREAVGLGEMTLDEKTTRAADAIKGSDAGITLAISIKDGEPAITAVQWLDESLSEIEQAGLQAILAGEHDDININHPASDATQDGPPGFSAAMPIPAAMMQSAQEDDSQDGAELRGLE